VKNRGTCRHAEHHRFFGIRHVGGMIACLCFSIVFATACGFMETGASPFSQGGSAPGYSFNAWKYGKHEVSLVMQRAASEVLSRPALLRDRQRKTVPHILSQQTGLYPQPEIKKPS
jgi:hypothetical protein